MKSPLVTALFPTETPNIEQLRATSLTKNPSALANL